MNAARRWGRNGRPSTIWKRTSPAGVIAGMVTGTVVTIVWRVWLKAPTTFAHEPDTLIYPHINEMLDVDPSDHSLLLTDPFDLTSVTPDWSSRTRWYAGIWGRL